MADVFRRRFARVLMDHGSEEAPRRIEQLRQVLAVHARRRAVAKELA